MFTQKVCANGFEDGKESSKNWLTSIPECDHKDADTGVCLHLKNTLQKGAQTIIIRSVDTDIIVLLAGLFFHLTKDYPTIKPWVAFGLVKTYQHICINTIYKKLGMHKFGFVRLPRIHRL